MFKGGNKGHEDKQDWRGDADNYDYNMPGPGNAPGDGQGKWDTYNWGGRQTGSWWGDTQDNRK